jgi:hypothetical protein
LTRFWDFARMVSHEEHCERVSENQQRPQRLRATAPFRAKRQQPERPAKSRPVISRHSAFINGEARLGIMAENPDSGNGVGVFIF